MTQGLWREPERYLALDWSTLPGLWVQGDRAVRHADTSWEIIGRSDDVLKVAGKRIGPTEMESIAVEVDGVIAAAAVGVPHPTKGQVPVIVVVATPARRWTCRCPAMSRTVPPKSFGKPLRPEAVLVVDAMPLTRSGKIHRRVLGGLGQRGGSGRSLHAGQPRDRVRHPSGGSAAQLTEKLGARLFDHGAEAFLGVGSEHVEHLQGPTSARTPVGRR